MRARCSCAKYIVIRSIRLIQPTQHFIFADDVAWIVEAGRTFECLFWIDIAFNLYLDSAAICEIQKFRILNLWFFQNV